MEENRLSFAEAREAASAGLVFTSHTPVAAGHDYFPSYLMDRYFTDYARSLGLSRWDFLALGRQNASDENEPFCMTVLALRLAAHSNGVSKLHGVVSRQMWQRIWPGVPENEIPIGYVTNGVHFRSWISEEMEQLYDRYLGPRWLEEPADQSVWQEVAHVPSVELWRSHERRRERLVSFAREHLLADLRRRGASDSEIEVADTVLDPDALTIGFARRFATYKRATLLFRDPDRLARILNDPKRPVQLIFAGKAHPRDDSGKEFIRQIVHFSRQDRFKRRLIFLEQYDTALARYLVQGADVWLNNPRRPLEASGTSGMKAAANGVLNLSSLDGWWDEAWHDADRSQPPIGWAIGQGESYDSPEYQDQVEAEALYDLLEEDVVPTFYDRGADGLPRRWIARMKSSIGQLCHFFNTDRMVREYTERFYLPAGERYRAMTADYVCRAGALAVWRTKLQKCWPQIQIDEVDGETPLDVPAGGEFEAKAVVRLGELTPADVSVELYVGRVDARGDIVDATAQPMKPTDEARDGVYTFRSIVSSGDGSGLHGYTVRVIPKHPDLTTPFLPGLITWPSTETRS
jgi:glycogen phosphorylase